MAALRVMGMARAAWAVARAELSLVRRFPKLRWILPAIVVIPALYAYIYLDSVWDPASRTGALPVAIVNLDEGAELGDQRFELGRELVEALQARRTFAFKVMDDAHKARESVRSGQQVFALVIPRDFSLAAIAPARAGAGKLVVFASEGNNYLGAGFARRFASELGHQVNEALNERRWVIVLGNSDASRDSLQRWRDGVSALFQGSLELDKGLGALREGSATMAGGAVRLSESTAGAAEALRQTARATQALDSRRPSATELAALKDGTARAASGQAELQQGLGRLEQGAAQWAEGFASWRQEASSIPFIGDKTAESTEPLLAGAVALRSGAAQAKEAAATLATGFGEVSFGVTQLVDGLSSQASGLATLSARLPTEDRLAEWERGARAMADASSQARDSTAALQAGATRLATGLETLRRSLPASLDGPQGSAGGLAATVEPQLEIDAPVSNNGLGFLPNFIPVALWLGAVMTAFVFHLRRVPIALRGSPGVSVLMGKLMILTPVILAQAVCVLVMCEALLGLQPVHATGLALTMACSSITFMLLILLLVLLMGEAGKGAALVLLIVQLSAAGGVMPIELTSEFYGAISPWMPFTWSVKAVRASAFGAFGDEWDAALGVLLLFAAVLAGLLLLIGRWRFVPDQDHRPAIDS